MTPRDAHPELGRDLRFVRSVIDSPEHLSAAQIQQYNDRGYIFPLDVYDAHEVEANRVYFDDLMARAASAGWDAYSINGWQSHCAGMYDMIIEPRILDYVQDLLGQDLICWGAHFFCKMPGDSKRVSTRTARHKTRPGSRDPQAFAPLAAKTARASCPRSMARAW